MMEIETLTQLLSVTYQAGGSDLHLCGEIHPAMRRNGILEMVGNDVLSHEDIQGMIEKILSPEQKKKFLNDGDVDLSYSCKSTIDGHSLIHCRVNAFRDVDGCAMALRLIPNQIPTMEDIRLPTSVRGLIKQKHGLVVVCGPTGSGKTTTLASMLDAINRTEDVHIISIEDPVEYRFSMKKSVISQREVGRDCRNFYVGLKAALRQDPDVILVGEMRDAETISTALAAAETGQLVLTTLHTSNVIEAIDRLVQYFSADSYKQIRNEIANSFQGFVAQKLVPSKNGGRVAAFEVLLPTDATKNLIRIGQGYRFVDYMHPSLGMQTMEQSLEGLKNMHLID